MKINNVLMCMIILIITGCGKANDITEVYFESEDEKVSIELFKVEQSKSNAYYIVYGNLSLVSLMPSNNYVDLGCYQLKLERNITSDIYIDSVASFNPARLLLNESGKFDSKVYWSIDKKIEAKDLKRFTLVKVKNNCFYE